MKSYTVSTLIVAILLLILSAGLLMWFNQMAKSLDQKMMKAKSVNSFEQCASYGYPIQQSYPAICRVPGGKSYVQSIKPTTSPYFYK